MRQDETNPSPAGLDRVLVAQAIERQTLRDLQIGTYEALAARSKISRTTLWRIRRADERVDLRNFARLDSVFGWPSDTLVTIAARDVDGLQELGAPSDLVEWVRVKARNVSDVPETGTA